MVDHHPAKFGGHDIRVSGAIFLIYHEILQERVTQEPWDFVAKSFSRYATTLLSLVVIGAVVGKICCYFLMWSHKATWLESHETL